jgi:hypothetical protein
MELHFDKKGKFNKDYVSCKSIYKKGMSLYEIAQLLFAMNDCHKWFYHDNYEHNKFIEYIESWSEIGIKVDINNSDYIYFFPEKVCPQIYQIDTSEETYQPSEDLGVFIQLKDGQTDFMPHLKFISWSWNKLNDEMKTTVINKLNWSKLEK